MRAIDADAISYESIDSCDTGRHEHYYGTGIIAVRKEDIDAMPTIQPEIVRCKDCKNWDTTWTNDFSPNYHYCPMVDGVRKEDWFCADAERREDEH